MSRTLVLVTIALGWFTLSAPASVTVTVDLLDPSDGGLQPPAASVVVDVLVDLSPDDVWTTAGLRVTTFNAAFIRYALDSNMNEAIVNPGAENPFVSCLSRPRPRDGEARFENALATTAGGYCPASSLTATPTELNVAWFAAPPPNASSPSVDGAIARITFDIEAFSWCTCCPAGVFRSDSVPPGYEFVLARFECTDNQGGVVSGSFDAPMLLGADWVLVFDRDGTGICRWSVDFDRDIDLNDLTLLLSSFGLCLGQPGFVPRADLDNNACVDLADLTILLSVFGLPCCG